MSRQDHQQVTRVAPVEERLDVAKRKLKSGRAQIHKAVTNEQRSVPVELTHEEIRVEKRDVADRPADEADLRRAFQEATIRVPVRGEEAVASKETVVAEEVVIKKERTVETEPAGDSIHRKYANGTRQAGEGTVPHGNGYSQ